MKEKLKKLNYREIIAYLIVGVLTTIVSLGTYYLVTITFLNPNKPVELQIANIISWMFAVAFAYFTNRKYVFLSKEKNKVKEGTKFILSRLTTLGLDMLTMFIMVSVLNINDRIYKLVIIGNYVISKFFVFKKNKD